MKKKIIYQWTNKFKIILVNLEQSDILQSYADLTLIVVCTALENIDYA